MNQYKSKLSENQIAEHVNSFSHSFYFTPHNEIIYVTIKNNRIKLYGIFYKAIATINSNSSSIQINLSVKLRSALTFVFIISYAMFSYALFAEKILINRKYPTILERLEYFGIGIMLITLLLLVCLYKKKQFTNKVVAFLELE